MRLKFTRPKPVPQAMRKMMRFTETVAKERDGGRGVLDRLNRFLDENVPHAASFVHALHRDQQNAVSYKELRDAILNGHMSERTFRDWQNDYSRFVTRHLKPLWDKAASDYSKGLEAKHPGFFYDPMQKGVQDWIKRNGARWVTNESAVTKEAIKAMLNYSTTGAYTVDELARVIRPTIGLTKPQAQANLRYYNRVKANLAANHPRMKPETVEKRAREAAMKYAESQHRQRAETIAQTELAFAYNQGAEQAVRQAQEQGYMGKMAKVWSAAGDNPCPICLDLDGTQIEMGVDFKIPGTPLFPGAHELPPAHPRCRCAVEYIEVEPPRDMGAMPHEQYTSASDEGSTADENSIDYMSAGFKPTYGAPKQLTQIGAVTIIVKPVMNSRFKMYTDTDSTKRNKAVRLNEKILREVEQTLPTGAEIPKISVVDFDRHDLNAAAIGGYDRAADIVFLNSKYDTPRKIREYLTEIKGLFSSEATEAPVLHELGHKYYEDVVKRVAISQKKDYNKAKRIVDAALLEYIHKRNSDGSFLADNISIYAEKGYRIGSYSEIVAECFAAMSTNIYAAEIIEVMEVLDNDKRFAQGGTEIVQTITRSKNS